MSRIDVEKIRIDETRAISPDIVNEISDLMSGKRSSIPAMHWFDEFTFLGNNEDAKQRIVRDCVGQGYVPIIDYDSELGWVFHSLNCPGGAISKKSIALRFEIEVSQEKLEAQLESLIVEELAVRGDNPRRQVRCAAGTIDILTDNAVYEVEFQLHRSKVFEAVGQVLLYRQAVDPSLRAVIVGNWASNSASLIPFAEKLGVEVWIWNK